MQIVYKVNGRIFESEKEAREFENSEEAREFENSERVALISKINEMKDSVLPKAYKRMVIAKENLSVIYKLPKKKRS